VIVYLVRHAPAAQRDAARWPDDASRPLTKKGERKFSRAAAGLARLAEPPSLVLASLHARAWRTAELLEEHAGWPAPQACPALAADLDASEAIPELEALHMTDAESVALVGHEPTMSELLSLLLVGDETLLPAPFKKGAVARLTLTTPPAPASAQLDWFVTPGMLRRFARG
jgi:phosphohistidine phosphatase